MKFFINFVFTNALLMNDYALRHLPKRFSQAAVALSMTLILTLTSCNDSASWQKGRGMIWNTVWNVTYLGTSELLSDAIDSLESVASSLSVFDPESMISVINRSESAPVDKHIAEVYDMSVSVFKKSQGMFDPTIAPLIQAWGFGKGHTPTSDTARIEQILDHTGLMRTHIRDGRLYKDDRNIEFNFSAIAKGYGVDEAAKAFTSKGCKDFMLEVGGEIVCHGLNPDGKKWKILIETPDEDFLRRYFSGDRHPKFTDNLVVELSDEALATSGNYRNYFENGSGTYGHTISPKTGRPVRTDILSASVVAPTCMEADAMATACMALGSFEGMIMLDDAGLAGAFILDNGDIVLSKNMKARIKN